MQVSIPHTLTQWFSTYFTFVGHVCSSLYGPHPQNIDTTCLALRILHGPQCVLIGLEVACGLRTTALIKVHGTNYEEIIGQIHVLGT